MRSAGWTSTQKPPEDGDGHNFGCIQNRRPYYPTTQYGNNSTPPVEVRSLVWCVQCGRRVLDAALPSGYLRNISTDSLCPGIAAVSWKSGKFREL
ncbi:hypothetical protein MHYP_G00008460 [Metynnis hypsauchen]